jgi:glycosyltransferase involved in cell wall biosynthesis
MFREVRRIIRAEDIQIAHFHNTFPLVSPSAYYAARAENVPVVQTLHNYRLVCPAAIFYRDGRVCEECVGSAVPWPAVRHACYRGSRTQTAALVGMLSLHRLAGTWENTINTYVALTHFARSKFVAGGLPASKLIVKPNFAPIDPGIGDGHGGFALFVGRITTDKGVQTMIDAWRRLESKVPLKIAGDGPMLESLSDQVRDLPNVEVLGRCGREDVLRLMKAARVLVVPSLWYEGFPMTIVEAYSCGLPVIASDLGSLAAVVPHGETGLVFQPGDPNSLAEAVRQIFADPETEKGMRSKARSAFEESYSAEQGYAGLMSVYQAAQRNRHRLMSRRLRPAVVPGESQQ